MTPPSSSGMQCRARLFRNYYNKTDPSTALGLAVPLTLRRIVRSCTAPGSAQPCSRGPWRRRAAGLCGRHIGVSSGVWRPSPACTGACTCPAGVHRGGLAEPSWSYPSPPESWGGEQQCWSLVGSPHTCFASSPIQQTLPVSSQSLSQFNTILRQKKVLCVLSINVLHKLDLLLNPRHHA